MDEGPSQQDTSQAANSQQGPSQQVPSQNANTQQGPSRQPTSRQPTSQAAASRLRLARVLQQAAEDLQQELLQQQQARRPFRPRNPRWYCPCGHCNAKFG